MNSSNSIIKLTDSFDSIIEKKNYTTEYIKDYFNIKTVEDFIKILPYKHTIISFLVSNSFHNFPSDIQLYPHFYHFFIYWEK